MSSRFLSATKSTTDCSGIYLWFDTEFTTLDLERARPLQAALLITDHRLRRLLPAACDLRLPIRLPSRAFVSPWSRRHLADLLRVCRSPAAVPVEEADRRLAALTDRVAGRPQRLDSRRPVLAGNSIHADWRIAQRFFPRFASRINYRHLDVTSLKLQWLARRQADGKDEFVKEDATLIRRLFPEAALDATVTRHDAYYDVQASIAELAFYRRKLCRRGLFE